MGRIKGWRVILITIVLGILAIETVLLYRSTTTLSLATPTVTDSSESPDNENSNFISTFDDSRETEEALGIYSFFNDQRNQAYYWVDLGSVDSKEQAVAKQKILQSYAIYASVQPIGSGEFLHLLVGPYESYEVAERASVQILPRVLEIQ